MTKIYNLKKQKIQKVSKLPKIDTKPKVERHDVLFDILHLKSLLNTNNYVNNVCNYMNKFFFKYGTDIFMDDGITFNLLSLEEAKKKIPSDYKKSIITSTGNREITKEISLRSYFESEYFLKSNEAKLTIDYDKDYKFIESEYIRGFEVKYTYLNMKKDLPLNYNKVITKTEDNMKGVQMFFDHIKEILCSNIEEEYSVVKKFLASSCAGHKVKIALYMQSLEQSGKGTVLNFMNKLLGSRMCKTSNTETVERYNKEFEGCTLINLDELPVAGTNKPLQDILKALITEPTFSCRGMYSAPYTQKNTFNICLSTNNNGISLTQTNHIRYYVLTISHKYCEISTEKAKKEKKEYFDKLYKYLDNEDIQILIFQEFMRIYNEEVKPSNWTGAYENLNTTAGKIKRMDAMPEFFKNLKKDYLSNGLGIDERCSTFIDTYNMSAKLKLTPHKIGDFLKMLNVDIKEVKRGGESKFRKYVISYEKLLSRFKELNYIDPEYDDFPDNPDDIENDIENPLDAGIIKSETKIETISKSEYDKLFKEYETLKLQLEALKFNQEVQQVDQEMTKPKKINKSTKNITKKEKVNKSTKNSKSIINIETKESNADDSESEIKNIIDDIEIF